MMDCQRCDGEVRYGDTVEMKGGIKARLCIACQNRFTVMLNGSKAYQAWAKSTAYFNALLARNGTANPGREEEWAEAVRLSEVADRLLASASLDFIKPLPKPEAEPLATE